MADVFISYKRDDQAEARALAELIGDSGLNVWWDRELLAGVHFDEVIEDELSLATCVVVIWSSTSVKSQYVRDEATYALNRKKLIPISIDGVMPPFRFQGLHTLQIAIPIQGDRNKAVRDALLESIRVRHHDFDEKALVSTDDQMTMVEEDDITMPPSPVRAQPQSFVTRSMSALRSLLPADASERLQSFSTITIAALKEHGYTNLQRDGMYWTGTTGFEQTTWPDRFALKIRCATPLAYKKWKPVTDKRCEKEAHGYALSSGYQGFAVLGFKINWLSTAFGMGPDVTYEVQFRRA